MLKNFMLKMLTFLNNQLYVHMLNADIIDLMITYLINLFSFFSKLFSAICIFCTVVKGVEKKVDKKMYLPFLKFYSPFLLSLFFDI